jgi:hypothetical protein
MTEIIADLWAVGLEVGYIVIIYATYLKNRGV